MVIVSVSPNFKAALICLLQSGNLCECNDKIEFSSAGVLNSLYFILFSTTHGNTQSTDFSHYEKWLDNVSRCTEVTGATGVEYINDLGSLVSKLTYSMEHLA